MTTASTSADAKTFLDEFDAHARVLAIDSHQAWPAGASAELGAAARIHEELRSKGLEVKFDAPKPDETAPGEKPRVSVSLVDLQGNHVRSLSASEAADLATGRLRI